VIPIMCCDTVNRGVAYATADLPAPGRHHVDRARAKTGAKVWSVMDGEAGKGQSGTDAPFVFKDKVLVGISGGEFGVRGWSAPTTSRTASWPGAAFEGPDADTLIDPVRPPRSASRSERFIDLHLAGRSMEDRRRRHMGWYSYDPELNLVYYGSGNPSTWNPVQRPATTSGRCRSGARLDTGAVKWIYQMTPHDEWTSTASTR